MPEPSEIDAPSPSNSIVIAGAMLKEIGGIGPVKASIFRASQLAGLPYWRTYELWYGRARTIEPQEAEKIIQAWGNPDARALKELDALKIRIARLRARMGQEDEDFHRPHLDYYRWVLCERG